LGGPPVEAEVVVEVVFPGVELGVVPTVVAVASVVVVTTPPVGLVVGGVVGASVAVVVAAGGWVTVKVFGT